MQRKDKSCGKNALRLAEKQCASNKKDYEALAHNITEKDFVRCDNRTCKSDCTVMAEKVTKVLLGDLHDDALIEILKRVEYGLLGVVRCVNHRFRRLVDVVLHGRLPRVSVSLLEPSMSWWAFEAFSDCWVVSRHRKRRVRFDKFLGDCGKFMDEASLKECLDGIAPSCYDHSMKVVMGAIESDRVSIVRHFQKKYNFCVYWTKLCEFCVAAVEANAVEVLDFLHGILGRQQTTLVGRCRQLHIYAEILYSAARCGDVCILNKFAVFHRECAEHDERYLLKLADAAGFGGHIATMVWLSTFPSFDVYWDDVMHAAILHGKMACFLWIAHRGVFVQPWHVEAAEENGDEELINIVSFYNYGYDH